MTVVLDIPYKSQCDPDASASRNDCGPACLAMILNGLGQPVTTDAVFRRTGAAPDGYVSSAQLLRVADSYRSPLEFRRNWGLMELHTMIDLNRPLIALVHYAAFSELQPGMSTQSSFKGPHYVLVVGYDDDHVIVHDPLWAGNRRDEGAYKVWPNAVWMHAWGRCHEDGDACGNYNPDFSALISVYQLPSRARARVPTSVIRCIRAKAALDGKPQPDLTRPATLNAYVTALGNWGQHVVVRRVEPTDTLWRLAKAYYGDGNRLNVIQYFNGLAETDVIQDGQLLLIPEPPLSGVIPENRQPAGKTAAFTLVGG